MRVVILLLILWSSLFGTYYNTLQLNAEAMIFPKLLLLKKDLRTLLVDGSIRFYILCEPGDSAVAERIKARMDRLYPGTLEGYPFKVTVVQYHRLESITSASAMFMLHSDTQLKKSAAYAKKHGIISFVYDVTYLKDGFLFALGIERTTLIYLNRTELPEYGIEFSDVLYQIVRFVDEDAQNGFTLE